MLRYLFAALLAMSIIGAASAHSQRVATTSISYVVTTGSSAHKSHYKYSKKHKHYKKKKRYKSSECEAYGHKMWMSGWSNKKKYWKHNTHWSSYKGGDDDDDDDEDDEDYDDDDEE